MGMKRIWNYGRTYNFCGLFSMNGKSMGKERPSPLAAVQWKNPYLVWILIMSRAVCIREHRGLQFKLESLSGHDAESAVAVV